MEIIIKECILQTVRETIPVEELLKLYMNETVENATEVHEREEIISQEPIIDKTVAGNISDPANTPMSAKQLAEEAETLSKIKAASLASTPEASGASGASGVSFNMDNNQVIPIENISSESRSGDNYDDDDDDGEYDDDDDDDDSDSVKLNIGDNVELSVDPFPSDDEDNDSNIDLKIEEIPIIDDF